MDRHSDRSSASSTLMTRRRFVTLMALGAAFSVLPGRTVEASPSMGPALQEAAPTVLPHAASVTWWGHVPLMVAVEKGFFSEVGLTVELVPIVASSDRMLAITSGAVQWTNSGSFAAIGEMAKDNQTFYWVANVDDSPGNQGIVAQPGIADIPSLKGKKVAVTLNADAEMMLNELLEMNGLTVNDIDLVPMKANDMAATFANKNVDAYAVWEPAFSDGQKAVPGSKVLAKDTDTATYQKYGTQMAPDMVILRRDLVDKFPDTTRTLLGAYFKGVDLVIADPAEAARTVMEKYFKKSFDDTLAGIKGFSYFGAATQAERTQKLQGTLSAVVEWQNRTGRIPNTPDPGQWLRVDAVPV